MHQLLLILLLTKLSNGQYINNDDSSSISLPPAPKIPIDVTNVGLLSQSESLTKRGEFPSDAIPIGCYCMEKECSSTVKPIRGSPIIGTASSNGKYFSSSTKVQAKQGEVLFLLMLNASVQFSNTFPTRTRYWQILKSTETVVGADETYHVDYEYTRGIELTKTNDLGLRLGVHVPVGLFPDLEAKLSMSFQENINIIEKETVPQQCDFPAKNVSQRIGIYQLHETYAIHSDQVILNYIIEQNKRSVEHCTWFFDLLAKKCTCTYRVLDSLEYLTEKLLPVSGDDLNPTVAELMRPSESIQEKIPIVRNKYWGLKIFMIIFLSLLTLVLIVVSALFGRRLFRRIRYRTSGEDAREFVEQENN
ncbi:unnamed protein product [Didymodactylos carnosus]|uniref:Uncharacterized protein n=1 Tax=Didymodactylos carnosus TaxID=1234261 RepID=A0A815EJD7_9BILA|nr:unnamed protein product [Didymodactylos carnosus]CAF1547040.1 unnamed protein product [Didymodactylos carnosus]CAF4141767.1 unnamed protein product [Didymodactylos carnosus]CAF4336266.1 unnamed protein product [Didymodactylos carnosus]